MVFNRAVTAGTRAGSWLNRRSCDGSATLDSQDAPPDRGTFHTPITTSSIVVLPVRIELTTSPLPRGCSTTELRQRQAGGEKAGCASAEKARRSLPQGRRGRKHSQSVWYRSLCSRWPAVVVSAHERTARGFRSRASQARGKGQAPTSAWRGPAGESQAAQGASQGPRRVRRRRDRRKTPRFRRNWHR